jgi:hypothetical protein
MAETPQWEYRVLTIGGSFGTKDEQIHATLNECGMEGWEAIHVYTPSQCGKVTIVAKHFVTAASRWRAAWPGQS